MTLRIGQLARMTSTTVRVLRSYEAHGLIRGERLPNGYRDYAPESVEQVLWIKELITCGFAPREIAGFLPCGEQLEPHSYAQGILQHEQKLAELDALIRRLTDRRLRLESRITQLRQGTAVPGCPETAATRPAG